MRRLIATLVAAAVALIVVLGCAFWYLVDLDRSHPSTPAQIVIPRGSTLADIAALLQSRGVIANALSFRVLARLEHSDAEVRAGAYAFAAHATEREILEQLVSGGAQVATWVSIPEGFSDRQIAERLQRENIGQSARYEHAFRSGTLDVDGTTVHDLEGFLFPNTYLVPLAATPEQVIKQMTDEFFHVLPANAPQRAKALGISVPQAVIVASLVEREAKIDADRPLIASVIYNRLRLHMPLQIDATIEYALPHHKSELSLSDLKIDSPYNTYLHTGLPPTPIANPGLPSLLAALNPAKTAALYYVYCGNGHHVFANTLAEHQANVARCLK